MKRIKSPFRWWFILIWFVGLALFFAAVSARENIPILIAALPLLALPVFLWILNTKKNKRIKAEEQKKIDAENAEKAAKEAWEEAVKTISFTAQNTDQSVLKKLYNDQEKDDLFMPKCVLYPREDGYAVYADSDRVGEIRGETAIKLKEYSEKYNLLGTPYDVCFGDETDANGEPIYSINITVRFHE